MLPYCTQEHAAKAKDMLHSFNKKDKNAKKETEAKVEKIEAELKARHERELKAKTEVCHRV